MQRLHHTPPREPGQGARLCPSTFAPARPAPTREHMAAPRCGVPDLAGGPSPRFATRCPWHRRNLTYQFGRVTNDVAVQLVVNAVRRAFNAWAAAGVGLSFRVLSAGDISVIADIRIEWRQAADPDTDMVGSAVAHADYPPDCSVITNDFPKPLHFDDDEETWVDGAVPGGLDIESVALHEIRHVLGLDHTDVNGSVMWPYISTDFTLRTLQADDLASSRALSLPCLLMLLRSGPSPQPNTAAVVSTIGFFPKIYVGRMVHPATIVVRHDSLAHSKRC
jgi:hypothetical protein